MKKVLKLIVVIAVISALTLVAFAASPSVTPVDPTPYTPPATDPTPTTEPTTEPAEGELVNENPASEIVSATAEIPEGMKVEIVAPTNEAANLAAAAAEHPDGLALGSFDVNLTGADGEELHSGATVTITITVPAEYVGGTLYLYEDGVLAQTIAINSTTVTLVISSFSTYTPVLVKAAATVPGGPVTPQTMQTLLPYALGVLAVAALAVAVVAKKRSFN